MRRELIPVRSMVVENLSVGRMEPVRFIEEAAEAGFGAVGLALATATPVPLEHEIVGRPATLRSIQQALRSTGVRVFDIEAFVLAPSFTTELCRRTMQAGAELGATHVSVIGQQKGAPESLAPQQRTDVFGTICDEARQAGLVVGVECMLYREVSTVADALALIDAAGFDGPGLILDVLHLWRAGTTVAEIAALSLDRVAYAQICDVAPGPAPSLDRLPIEARTGRLQPGDGIADLEGFLDALPDGTRLAVETPVADEAGWPTAKRLAHAARCAERLVHTWAGRGSGSGGPQTRGFA